MDCVSAIKIYYYYYYYWKPLLNSIGIKVARVIGLLRKLKYTLPTQVLRSIYDSLILPHMHYALLAWGTKCHKIELLQKKALRIIFSKSPIAHTEPGVMLNLFSGWPIGPAKIDFGWPAVSFTGPRYYYRFW